MASCATCGERLPKSSRYCPQCGQPTTKTVEYAEADRHYYGVTPTWLALGLAAAVAILGIVLLAIGHWPIGLILLGVSVLLALLTVESRAVRARAGVAADSVATRGGARMRIIALRRELRKMAVLRGRLLLELGDAVYRGDDQATEAARQRVVELDEVWRQREAEMQAVIAQAQDRLRRHKLEVQPTEMVELPDGPDPGAPAVIPEPYPPPDEGDPPEPAIIPEQEPAVIPEPGPQGLEGKGS